MKIVEVEQSKPILIENITQRKVALLGGTGSGKTTILKMLAYYSKVAYVMLDILGVVKIEDSEYLVKPQHIRVDSKSIRRGNINDIIMVVMELIREKTPVILSFEGLSHEEIIMFSDMFFEKYYVPGSIIYVDEVHEIAHQQGLSSLEFLRFFKVARNHNMGFIVDSQRPAFVDKDILALCDYMVILRVTYPNDSDVVKALIGGIAGDETKAIIAEMQQMQYLEGYTVDFVPEKRT